MSIREAWAYLSLASLLLAVQQLRSRVALLPIVALLVSVPVIYTIRSYLVPLIIAGVMLSLVVVRVRQLPFALVALVLVGGVVAAFGDDLGITTELVSEQKLEEMHKLRNGLAYGGSAYGADADTRTLAGTIAYLPQGTAYFLFAPFPWAIRSWRQAMTLPESILWFVLFYQAARAVWQDARRNLASIATPLLVVVLVTIAYAIVSGNEGTAYRHRAQVMLVVLMFSAAYQVRSSSSSSSSAQPARSEQSKPPMELVST